MNKPHCCLECIKSSVCRAFCGAKVLTSISCTFCPDCDAFEEAEYIVTTA